MLRQTAQNLGVRLAGAQRALPGSCAGEQVPQGACRSRAQPRWRTVAARSRLTKALSLAGLAEGPAVHRRRWLNADLAENRPREAGVLGLTRRRRTAAAAAAALPGWRRHAATLSFQCHGAIRHGSSTKRVLGIACRRLGQ